MKKLSLLELSELVDGQLHGDGSIEILGAATLRDAKQGEISLADRPELAKEVAVSEASAVVVPKSCTLGEIPHITVENVHQAFIKIVNYFSPARGRPRSGISPAAHLSSSAKIADNVDIYPGATIGEDVEIGSGSTIYGGVQIMSGCKIGEDATIFPNAVLYENTILGDRVIIHSGAILGSYGFGYEPVDGRHQISAQLGNVVLESDVEVGACTTIDRGTYGPTRIGEGTKIDNQVMIAHNCRIGRHNLLCSQVGIAGSTTTGDYVVMAGQVGVRDHVQIGDRSVLAAKAGISNDVPADKVYIGIPATPEREQKLRIAAIARLPEMRKQLKLLQRTVQQLTDSIELPSSQDAA